MKIDRTPRARNETADLTRPIMGALNAMPGVRVARNNTGVLQWKGQRCPKCGHQEGGNRQNRIQYGLGIGSADLCGIVKMRVGLTVRGEGYESRDFGRVFCLEVKWPGKHATDDQIVWLRVVRSLGGFATVVTSIEDAIAAVEREKEGEK